MGHRVPLARHFNVDYKCNVFMLSYRGQVENLLGQIEQGLLLPTGTVCRKASHLSWVSSLLTVLCRK